VYVKRTAWPVVTALESVSVMVLPEIAIELTEREALATDTPKALANSPEFAKFSSKFSVNCVGVEVLTLPER
jgi:hypothetical protein